MAEIINLRRARKQKAHRQKDTEAAAKRQEFGTPKFEKLRTQSNRVKDAQKIDAHKLDDENG